MGLNAVTVAKEMGGNGDFVPTPAVIQVKSGHLFLNG